MYNNNKIRLLLYKLQLYPHILDLIYYYLYDLENTILSNQIINLNSTSIQLCHNNYYNNNLILFNLNVKYSNIQKLYLGWNNLENITNLLRSLKYTKIKYINLSNNRIKNIIGFKFLYNTQIKEIDISNNYIENIYFLIQLIINSNLEKINLANNPVKNVDKLIDNIKYSSLSYLFLNSSCISDKTIIQKVILNRFKKKCKIIVYTNYK